jgi:hypothetical protein
MPKIIDPDSAVDWFTVRQLCETAAAELVAAHPLEPMRGRIDLYRPVEIRGRKYCVRVKLTILPAGAAVEG